MSAHSKPPIDMDSRTYRLLRVLVLLFGVSLAGTFGYHYLEGWSMLDSLYMTVITLTTVGFGEVRHMDDLGRWFTIALMISSVGIVAYAATTLGQIIVETEFRTVIWKRRMDKRIAVVKGHAVVCGYGRTGRAVCAELERNHMPYVVVESKPATVAELKSQEVMLVAGDASADESLHDAGIERAASLVAALGNDAENVYLVLSARQLNPRLRIVAWATTQEAENKIVRAGADYVLSPYLLGGARMVHYLVTPHALAFLDQAMRGEYHDVHVSEIAIGATSPLVGGSLKTLGIGREIGVIVIGVVRAGGEMIFNPPADFVFREQDILIGIGSKEQFTRLRALVETP